MAESKFSSKCYQCGWLGLCIIACPLADPANDLPRDISTAPAAQLDPDAEFEILYGEPCQYSSPTGQALPPAISDK